MPVVLTNKPLRPRPELDFYETPIELCGAAIASCLLSGVRVPIGRYGVNGHRVLDPGAGTGNWGKALRKDPRFDGAELVGVELETTYPAVVGYDEWLFGDFLALPSYMGHHFTHIIGNPPYKLAEEFVRKSLEMLVNDGELIFLLRLDFLASRKRATGLFKEFRPHSVWVCSDRPSFTGNGKTNAMEYAIFKWVKGKYFTTTNINFWPWKDWEGCKDGRFAVDAQDSDLDRGRTDQGVSEPPAALREGVASGSDISEAA